jgi:uncharacterized protein YjiS (DUF1127 family)
MANTEVTRLHRDPTRIWAPAGMAHRIGEIQALLAEWMRRRRFRADLKRLLKVGPHMIADIGFTLEAAMDESKKPFWRP